MPMGGLLPYTEPYTSMSPEQQQRLVAGMQAADTGNKAWQQAMPHIRQSWGREGRTDALNSQASIQEERNRRAAEFLARLQGANSPGGGGNQSLANRPPPEPPPEPIMGKMGPGGLSSLQMPPDAKPVHQPGSRGYTNEYMIGTKDRPQYQAEVARRRALAEAKRSPSTQQPQAPSGPPRFMQGGGGGMPVGAFRNASPLQRVGMMAERGMANNDWALQQMSRTAPFRQAMKNRQQEFMNQRMLNAEKLAQRKQIGNEFNDQFGQGVVDQKMGLDRAKMMMDANYRAGVVGLRSIAQQAGILMSGINSAIENGEEPPPELLQQFYALQKKAEDIYNSRNDLPPMTYFEAYSNASGGQAPTAEPSPAPDEPPARPTGDVRSNPQPPPPSERPRTGAGREGRRFVPQAGKPPITEMLGDFLFGTGWAGNMNRRIGP